MKAQARSFMHASVVTAALLPGGSCTSVRMDAPDREFQESMTPEQILDLARTGNDRYRRGEQVPYDLRLARHQTARDQFPAAIVLGCIDSRVPVEIIFDLGIGDVFVARVAGNVAGEDMVGSMEYACKFAGSKVVLVMGHTNCGAVKGACDGIELGNLTGLLASIQPAVDAVQDVPGERNSTNAAFVDAVAAQNVELAVREIRRISPVLSELEEAGKVLILGCMYDVATGRVTFLNE